MARRPVEAASASAGPVVPRAPGVEPQFPVASNGSEPNLYIAWYEGWRSAQDARREAEAAARVHMERGVRWLVFALLCWAAAAGAAGAAALALWTGT